MKLLISRMATAQFLTVTVGGYSSFHIDQRYTNLEPMGDGSYGFVASATDTSSGHKVAISKVKDTFQVLRSLKHVNSVDKLHRDHKPSTLRVNAHCDLELCDFGLAVDLECLVPYWYCPPELLLECACGEPVDVWSSQRCSPVSPSSGAATPSSSCRPSSPSKAIELLVGMLQFSPTHLYTCAPVHRISMQEALAHPYLQHFLPTHRQMASPDHAVQPFRDLDKRESGSGGGGGGGGMTDAEVRHCMFEEVCKYRPYSYPYKDTCKEGKGSSSKGKKGSLKESAEGGDGGGDRGGDGGGDAMDVADDAHTACVHGGC
ncbi:kinase-like domain-containing protein [Ochromonadaceae sp. CCMP2298]|nr:kinase-like domain-containing protein [Ochromonadaceae sp. CCMP2298]